MAEDPQSELRRAIGSGDFSPACTLIQQYREQIVGLQDGVRAERHLAGRFLGHPADPGFEPLPAFIDEADQGDGGLTDVGREGGQLVVRQLGRGVQNAEAA